MPVSFGYNFFITNTSQFDAGYKQYGITLPAGTQTGNYLVETYTNNLRIDSGTLSISNKYSDTFSYVHPDLIADTWKWDYYEDESFSVCDGRIESGYLNMTIDSDTGDWAYNYISLSNVQLTGDFDIQVDYNITLDADAWDVYPALCITSDTESPMSASYYECASVAIELQNQYVAYTDWFSWNQYSNGTYNDSILGKFRIIRTSNATDTNISTMFWNYNSNEWEYQYDLLQNNANFLADMYVSLVHTSGGDYGKATTQFDNFKINSGELVSHNNAYKLGSIYWISENISIAERELEAVTIEYENADNYNFLKTVGFYIGTNLIAEADFTYNSETSTGTHVTITESMLTSGSFEDINDSFNIKLTLFKSNVVVDDKAIIIDSITGYFNEAPSGICAEEDIEIITESLDRNVVYVILLAVILAIGALIIKFVAF
jgi:hypothetical protein